MDAALPLISALLWIRVALGVIALVWLPGHLLAGRWLAEQDRLSRCMVSISVGLVLPFLYWALLGRFGLPFRPEFYFLAILMMATGTSFWSSYQRAIANWTRNVRALSPLENAAASSAMALSFLALLAGFSRMPAPPHLYDASNHAWLTLRIVQTASLSAARINADLAGTLPVGYLPGLHAAAALVARLSGVAPYVTVWMLTLLLCAMLPGAFSLLWRAWRVPASALSLALLLCVANPLGPGGILGWGGFGQITGFFMVAVGTLALRTAWRTPSKASGLAAGVVLGALVFLHASEVVVVFGAALLALDGPIRRSAGIGLLILAAILVLCAPEVWHVIGDYPKELALEPLTTKTALDALDRLWRAGGRDVFQLLLPLGWVLGLRSAWARRLVIASLGAGAFYLLLQTLADPVTRLLSTPFYRQAPRILYLQLYLLPPLLALPLTKLWFHLRFSADSPSRRAILVARGALTALLLAALIPGLTRVVRTYRSYSAFVPFTVDDYRQARSIPSLVPKDAVVANLWDDGSVWAMHVSKRNFLQPCAWLLFDESGRSLHALSSGLAKAPWPPDTLSLLRRRRVRYLYVSDGVLGRGCGLTRRNFDGDARFQALLVGSRSTLYALRGMPK